MVGWNYPSVKHWVGVAGLLTAGVYQVPGCYRVNCNTYLIFRKMVHFGHNAFRYISFLCEYFTAVSSVLVPSLPNGSFQLCTVCTLVLSPSPCQCISHWSSLLNTSLAWPILAKAVIPEIWLPRTSPYRSSRLAYTVYCILCCSCC